VVLKHRELYNIISKTRVRKILAATGVIKRLEIHCGGCESDRERLQSEHVIVENVTAG